jgi:galactose mutarotase-like enzyme
VTVDGHRIVVLENGRLRVAVMPDRGADIVEFRHKASDLDMLWRSPWLQRPAGSSARWSGSPETAFLHDYLGGWQEMAPTCGDAASYDGLPVGVHGEVLDLPWRWTVDVDEPEEVAVRFDVETVLAPLRLTRRMSLRHDRASLVLDERIEHVGATASEFMWGHHPAFGAPFLKEGCTIDTDARTILTTSHHSDPSGRLAPDRRSSWPVAEGVGGEAVDLSVVPGPGAGTHDWAYLTDFERGWYAVREPDEGIGFALRWPAATWPFVLFWQNYRGARAAPWHGRAYVAALEPQSTFPATWDRGAPRLRLDPGATMEVRMIATAFQRDGRVTHVDDEGRVT